MIVIFVSILHDVLFFFFFSSRRRHTRSDRDWSSDVCSSDLVAVVERRAVVAGPRLRLAREAMAIQRLVQPGAARVSREHATGAVRAVRRWRKPDNEQTRSGIAEARNRFAPIRPVRELTLLVARDTPAIGAQPRAARTRHNGAVDAGDRGQGIGGHSPNVIRG